MKASAFAIMAMFAFASGAFANNLEAYNDDIRHYGVITCYVYAINRLSSYDPIREVVNDCDAFEYSRRMRAYFTNREESKDYPFYEGQAACAFRVLEDIENLPDTRPARIGLAARYLSLAENGLAKLHAPDDGSAYGGLNIRQRREIDAYIAEAERAISEAELNFSERLRNGRR